MALIPAISSPVSSSGAPAPSKVGTISLQAAECDTAEGKQASAELQTQFAARSTELQNMQKQTEDIQAQLQSSLQMLSDGERGRLRREAERRTRTFQRKQQYLPDDLDVRQQDVMNDLGRETSGFSFHFQLAIAWLQFGPEGGEAETRVKPSAS